MVLTSLWVGDEVCAYAKPIRVGASTYALSREEQQAVDVAANRGIV